MNPADPDSSIPLASASEPHSAPRPAAAASRWLVAAIAVVLAAAGLLGWLDARRDANALRTDLAQRLASTDAALALAKSREADLSNDLRDAQAKLALLETRVGESQSQQAALETLYRDLAPSRDELAFTEIEQVLVLATQQLALAGNVQAALAALQLADAKLARMDRAQLGPLRRSLARDMDELKAVPYVDVAGISAKLEQAISAIDVLPLAKDQRLQATTPALPPANDPPWLRFLRESWADIKSLVRIEVSDRPAAPLVSPSEVYFLRENLRLRLLAARLALLSHDEKSFKSDLDAANGWVLTYFDPQSKPVQALSSTFKQMAATPMPAAMPDLSRSLELVRTVRMTRVDTPASAPPPPMPRGK